MRSSRALAAALRRRPSYADVMATFAAFMALGGVSYAAVTLPRDSVGTHGLERVAVSLAVSRKVLRVLARLIGVPGLT